MDMISYPASLKRWESGLRDPCTSLGALSFGEAGGRGWELKGRAQAIGTPVLAVAWSVHIQRTCWPLPIASSRRLKAAAQEIHAAGAAICRLELPCVTSSILSGGPPALWRACHADTAAAICKAGAGSSAGNALRTCKPPRCAGSACLHRPAVRLCSWNEGTNSRRALHCRTVLGLVWRQ